MKKLADITFLLVILGLLLLSIFYILNAKPVQTLQNPVIQEVIAYEGDTKTEPKNLSTRIKEYLEGYGSPFADEYQEFVMVGDRYGIDPRLLVGIFYLESSLGRHCGYSRYACFGWANGRSSPDTFMEGLEEVARGIRTIPYYADWRESGDMRDFECVYNGSESCREYGKKLERIMEEIGE